MFSGLTAKPSHRKNIFGLTASLVASGAVYAFKDVENIFLLFDFPLFPWAVFIAYGMILGTGITTHKNPEIMCRSGTLMISAVFL